MVIPDGQRLLAEKMIGTTNALAIPNGTRIKKVNSEPNDRTKDGALGTVIGGLPSPCLLKVNGIDILNGYIIEWDDDKDANGEPQRVFIIDHKVERLKTTT